MPLNDFNIMCVSNIEIFILGAILSEPLVPLFRLPVLHDLVNFGDSFLTVVLLMVGSSLFAPFRCLVALGSIAFDLVIDILTHGLLVHVVFIIA